MKVLILGSTGSIGKNVLNVISKNKKYFEVVGLSSKSNLELLEQQAKDFKVPYVCVVERNAKVFSCKNKKVFWGEEGILELIDKTKPDILVNAIVGIGGLKPTFYAIDKKIKNIAIANKETIVVGGNLLIKKIRKNKISLIPIDSEHIAILQCINNERKEDIKRVILTASGGPLFKKNIKDKTPEKITLHPVWKMGKKISVDSATLVNKGFEYIEAHFLFDIPYRNIDIIIHPQSIVHSLVEFIDGNIKAVLFCPDMCIPISYALGMCLNKRIENFSNTLSLYDLNRLEFYNVDYKKFPLLKLILNIAINQEHSYLVVFNAANEVLVEKFLNREIEFDEIYKILSKIIEEHKPIKIQSLNDILNLDKITREYLNKKFLKERK
ncbi:MAG: 1-deoxy-D-xylulose-5-phosphate reductoisomerase [Elusimicrobiota bacterium]|nr:1-deoxy-D-xylulose-5-phosphate reductoisomerase [Endomicrobiia bacterium]MDW8164949.1 1-deoxy-D-xylulose-5-phosphate reductoisomerase [Elusimicrobiota bacterium]